MAEAVAVAVHLQDVDVVGEPVQQRAGGALRAEDLGPIVEGKIGGYQNRARLVYTLASSRAVPKAVLRWIRAWGESGFPAIFLGPSQHPGLVQDRRTVQQN